MGISFGKERLANEIIKNTWKGDKKYFSYNELLYVLQEATIDDGRKYLEQHSALRGHEIFRGFVKHLLYRNVANFDSMLLVSSDKGMGKSSVAIMIARHWCKLIGIKFDPNRHIAYNNADLMNKLNELKPFEPIICDEAVRFASAADWAKKSNKELVKRLAQVRTKHLLYILCFPLKINKLEKNYLESFTNYWLDIYDRGKGAIYVKDKNPSNDSWRLKHFEKLGSYTEFTNSKLIEQKLKKHPNFWMMIKIPKPPVWLYNRYLKVREKNVYNEENVLSTVTKEDIHKALLVLSLRDIMATDAAISMNRIILHIRNEYDLSLSKNMIQNLIDDAKQLVTKVQEKAISIK